MQYLLEYKEYTGFLKSENIILSEKLEYHYNNRISILNSIYRIGSESWIEIVKEARDLWERGEIELNEDDLFLISTEAGDVGIFEGAEVLLDVPFLETGEIYDLSESKKNRKLNRPFRTPAGPRKFSVYTKNDKGNVVKVGFGEPGMRVNNADPEKARSFRIRMRCDNPGPKW